MKVVRLSNVTEEQVPPAPSFDDVFDAHFAYVWHTLRRLGVQARDLDDVTHDVFVHVYRKLDDYDPERPLRPWLFGFAVRAASDYRRLARHRVEAIGSEVEHADREPLADERLARSQDAALVAAALETMDFDRRAVFVSHEIDGSAVPEIAAALGIPLNTAYSRLRLGREEFARAVKRLRAQRGGA